MVGTNESMATRFASEPRNQVAQYAGTDVRKASFAVRVMEPWNRLPTKHKNAGNLALKGPSHQIRSA
jgi:hypothetical protein